MVIHGQADALPLPVSLPVSERLYSSPQSSHREDALQIVYVPEGLLCGNKQYNPLVNKPTLVYHADRGSKPSKLWCAEAIVRTKAAESGTSKHA